MKIGIVGAKFIGSTLGKKWIKVGHEVRFGVRNTKNPELKDLITSLGSNTWVESIKTCIEFGEVIVFALPGAAVRGMVQEHSRELAGKIIIDASNNIGAKELNSLNAVTEFVKGALYYRAFNTYGWENFENPKFGSTVADLFYCGPQGPSRQKVEELIRAVGLEPLHVGGIETVVNVDAITGLWFALALKSGMGRHLAFKVLRAQ